MINFVSGGRMGDFIHTLYAVKNICEQRNEKANLYISHGGDEWKFGLERAYNDLYELLSSQSYINKLGMLSWPETPIVGPNETVIDLNTWRGTVGSPDAKIGAYNKCWSEVLSGDYGFTIPQEYKWININKTNEYVRNKIIIHRSMHHHNNGFPWERLLAGITDEVLFITTAEEEWEHFSFRYVNAKLKPYLLTTMTEMALALSSCKMFIGNQSSPFALASALDVPRLLELEYNPCGFYMDENKYSKNISWYLNNEVKFFTSEFPLKM